jgi:pimeloyl-ACP methyl ester carboxylesterase
LRPSAPTLLLVHGGWGGAWIWQPALTALDEHGVEVEAIDRLPSVGYDVSRLGGLRADAQAVREHLDVIGGPVVLCGHSYGGMVITEVADHPAITHSVYLAASGRPLASRSHCPQLSHPEELAQILTDVVVGRGESVPAH